jgi:hypothetical protein
MYVKGTVTNQAHIEQVHGNRTKKMVIQTYRVQSHFVRLNLLYNFLVITKCVFQLTRQQSIRNREVEIQRIGEFKIPDFKKLSLS